MITGEIKINEHRIARYKIVRQPPYSITPNTMADYKCVVTETRTDGYKWRADFIYENHRLGDGALVLVGKVMLECGQHMKRLPVRE